MTISNRNAVHQVAEPGYPVEEVPQRLGMSTHSLYGWIKKFSKPDQPNLGDEQTAENEHWVCLRNSGLFRRKKPKSLSVIGSL